jgi:phosphatidylglycerophosphatase A
VNILKKSLIKLAATGFGIGFTPIAPGTAGTLVCIPIFLILSYYSWQVYLLFLAAFTCAAVYLAQAAEKIFGEKDSPCIVIDEIVGFLWTMFFVPPSLMNIIFGFIFFRLFDIFKPFPARSLQDKLPGGYGVVGDDVMAGIYANIVLQILINSRYLLKI